MNPCVLSANLERKSGAKINHIFETTKFLGSFFQKYFKEPCCSASRGVFPSDCGCKGSALFLFSKHFIKKIAKLLRFFLWAGGYLYI